MEPLVGQIEKPDHEHWEDFQDMSPILSLGNRDHHWLN